MHDGFSIRKADDDIVEEDGKSSGIDSRLRPLENTRTKLARRASARTHRLLIHHRDVSVSSHLRSPYPSLDRSILRARRPWP